MKLEWYQRLYHGSNQIVKTPDLRLSREDIDFGVGFYLTTDINMAKKWSVSRATSVLNTYSLDIKNLQIYTFQLNAEWLEYIRVCRGYGENREEIKAVYEKYDVLIGPTADDKLFDTVQQYLDGELDTSTTVRYLNVAGYANQIVLKTQNAVAALHFTTSKEIFGLEKQQAKKMAREDRVQAMNKLNEMKRQDIKRKEINDRNV